MKNWLAAALAIVLVGCAATDRPRPTTPGHLLATAGGKGTLNCERKGGGGDAETKVADCRNIPVIVLFTGSFGSQCSLLIPYDSLSVNGRKDKTDIVWNLVAPEGYVIVDVPLTPATMTESKARIEQVYEPLMVAAAPGPSFKLTLRKGAPEANYSHDVVVTDGAGNRCASIDPIIHNDAN